MKNKVFVAILIIWAVVLVAVAIKSEKEAEASASYQQVTSNLTASNRQFTDKPETVSVVKLTESETEKETEAIRYYDIPLDNALQDCTRLCCSVWGLDPALVYAVIQVESGYNKDAYSNGNYGYMQINQICFDEYCVENPFSAQENISVGIRILGGYYAKYGSEEMALMAYNLGEGGASKMWNQGIYSTAYVEKVLTVKNQLIGGD